MSNNKFLKENIIFLESDTYNVVNEKKASI